ncbi:MAG: acyl-homoserine-lactone synthase [Alphaproteobacteria bacterium]
MIIGFTQANAYQYDDILRSTHALRYRAFIQRMAYDVPIWKGMEYDQYDNLSTVYLVWRDAHGVVRGTTRLAPTDRPYMIKDMWPELVTNQALPSSPFIWEASRFCVDNTIPSHLRREIISELVCAYQQICLLNGIEYMLGVMPPNVWHHVFGKSGWDIEFAGPETTLDTGEVIVVGKMHVSQAILQNILNATGLKAPPLKVTREMQSIIGDAVLSEPKVSETEAA